MATIVQASKKTGIRLCSYILCSIAVFSMSVQITNIVVFSLEAGIGVMLLEALYILDNFWFVNN